jgi:hypothetical protein
MPFSRFSVIESLVSSHLAPLSGPLSHYRIHYSDALRYSYLCVLIDQDGTKCSSVRYAADHRSDGAVPSSGTCHYAKKCG